MHTFLSILFDLLFLTTVCTAQSGNQKVLCYSCYDSYQLCDTNGNCEDIPPFSCSLQNYCEGDTCGFTIYEDNTWSAYCLDYNGAQLPTTGCYVDSGRIYCDCLSNFCNHPKNITEQGWGIFPTNSSYELNVTLALPSGDNVECYECGTFIANNENFSIPCDGSRVCDGAYCITRNHSLDGTYIAYCGTTWDPEPILFNDSSCAIDKLTKDTICVCDTNLCNTQDYTTPGLTTTIVPSSTASPPSGTDRSEQLEAIQDMADQYNKDHAGESGLASQIANSIFGSMLNSLSNDKNANITITVN